MNWRMSLPPRTREMLFLGILSFLCLMLFLVRAKMTHSITYIFLNWNLFLAFVPWALTSLVMVRPTWQQNKWISGAVMLVWLLFFPNAPYLVTDLFHLDHISSAPKWYDLVLVLSFAWTGLLFGFLSLWDIEYLLRQWIKPSWTTVVSILLLFVSSFGIYLGRFLRWNSWDVVSDPVSLLQDILDRFIHPTLHTRTWGVTITMFLFLNVVYWSFRHLTQRQERF